MFPATPLRARMGARTMLSAGVIAVLLAATAACGSSSSGGKPSSGSQPTGSSSASSTVDSAAAAMVPASIKAAGTITVGTDSTYAPNEFLESDGKTVEGFDVDLFNAVAAKLGLRTKYVSAVFGTIIEAVQSGKFQIGVSSFTVNQMREKQVVMVSYFQAGTQWATKQGDPTGIQPNSACGKHVAVQTNTVEVDDLQSRSKACQRAGKSAITIDQYTGQDQATEAAVSGKDDAVLADSPIMAYAVKQTHGELQLLGDIYDSAPYGYVLPKGDTAFGQAIVMALKDLVSDGTYAAVLKKWGVTPGAITTPAVNPKVSS